jgi:hypothetical protein
VLTTLNPSLTPGPAHAGRSLPAARRGFAIALLLLLACGEALGASMKPPPTAPPPGTQPNLMDFIAPPGTKDTLKPFMLHADLWVNLDRRLPLDSTVYSLEKGARCCRVLGPDSLWAIDYTWIYPHGVFPPRWYDADDLLRVGDSMKIADDALVTFTFGTCRVGMKAGSYEQAHAAALRNWPKEMPEALRGRLRLKLERAEKALHAGAAPDSLEPH